MCYISMSNLGTETNTPNSCTQALHVQMVRRAALGAQQVSAHSETLRSAVAPDNVSTASAPSLVSTASAGLSSFFASPSAGVAALLASAGGAWHEPQPWPLASHASVLHPKMNPLQHVQLRAWGYQVSLLIISSVSLLDG